MSRPASSIGAEHEYDVVAEEAELPEEEVVTYYTGRCPLPQACSKKNRLIAQSLDLEEVKSKVVHHLKCSPYHNMSPAAAKELVDQQPVECYQCKWSEWYDTNTWDGAIDAIVEETSDPALHVEPPPTVAAVAAIGAAPIVRAGAGHRRARQPGSPAFPPQPAHAVSPRRPGSPGFPPPPAHSVSRRPEAKAQPVSAASSSGLAQPVSAASSSGLQLSLAVPQTTATETVVLRKHQVQGMIDSLKRAHTAAQSAGHLCSKAARAFHEEAQVIKECSDVMQAYVAETDE